MIQQAVILNSDLMCQAILKPVFLAAPPLWFSQCAVLPVGLVGFAQEVAESPVVPAGALNSNTVYAVCQSGASVFNVTCEP